MSTYKKPNIDSPPSEFANCPDFLNRYLNYLSTFRNRSPATVIEVYVNLSEFFQFVHYTNKIQEKPPTKDAHKDMDISCMSLDELCNVSQEQIEEYLCFLETVVRNAVLTVRKKLLILRQFYLYIEKNAQELQVKLATGNPVRNIPIPNNSAHPIKALSDEQVSRLAKATTGECALRDTAIILTLATTGITLSELVSLNRKDLADDTLTIRRSGKRNREVYLTPDCVKALANYLSYIGPMDDSVPLFICLDSTRRMTGRAIHLRIAKAASVAGMSHLNITAKTLRDTAAVKLLSKTRTPVTKQQILSYLGCTSDQAGLRFKEVLNEKDS